MILFKPQHVKPILDGRKTQTRRLGKRRWNVGKTYQARTRMMDKGSTFALLEVGGIERQALQRIDDYDAWCEGYASVEEFSRVWRAIHGSDSWDANPDVWCVKFRLPRERHSVSLDGSLELLRAWESIGERVLTQCEFASFQTREDSERLLQRTRVRLAWWGAL